MSLSFEFCHFGCLRKGVMFQIIFYSHIFLVSSTFHICFIDFCRIGILILIHVWSSSLLGLHSMSYFLTLVTVIRELFVYTILPKTLLTILWSKPDLHTYLYPFCCSRHLRKIWTWEDRSPVVEDRKTLSWNLFQAN